MSGNNTPTYSSNIDTMIDEKITHLIMDSNEEGLKLLLRSYGGRTRSFLRKKFSAEIAEEALFQAAFTFWQKISQFDKAKGSLKAYFFTLAHNTAVDLKRRESRNRVLSLEDKYLNLLATSIDQRVELKRDSVLIEKLIHVVSKLAKIAPKQGAIIQNFLENDGQFDAKGIANQLNCSANSVYVQRNKAFKRLRLLFEELEEDEL